MLNVEDESEAPHTLSYFHTMISFLLKGRSDTDFHLVLVFGDMKRLHERRINDTALKPNYGMQSATSDEESRALLGHIICRIENGYPMLRAARVLVVCAESFFVGLLPGMASL